MSWVAVWLVAIFISALIVCCAVFANSKPKILIFSATWCTTCKQIAATTLTDPEVQKALRRYTVAKIDVSVPTPTVQSVQAKYRVVGVPTIIILNAQGREVRRFVGYVSASTLRGYL